MNKKFTLYYGGFKDEYVVLQVTDEFTKEKAEEFIGFFSWSDQFTKSPDPIVEAVYRIASECLYVGKTGDLSFYGVQNSFENKEGFFMLDGSEGIELLEAEFSEIEVDPNEFYEEGE